MPSERAEEDMMVEAPIGSYENPADERVWVAHRTLVVAARGPFGIVRAVQVGCFNPDGNARLLKVEVAKHVGMMTPGVYWSQHVYGGVPWYVTAGSTTNVREECNGIWLYEWLPLPEDPFGHKFQAWDYRTEYGEARWTAVTTKHPAKLADLPRGM